MSERSKLRAAQAKAARYKADEFYGIHSLLGYWNWAMFYFLIGGRMAGKSYAVMEQFLRDWKRLKRPFYWIRYKEDNANQLLANNANKLVDADLYRKYGLDLKTKGKDVYDHDEKMCTVLSLSTFYKDKGQAYFDSEYDGGYNLCCDECSPEEGEIIRFDPLYCLSGCIENIIRDTKQGVRIFLICNYCTEVNSLLANFNFIPETFGRYKIKSKRCVIDYIPPTEAYKKRRQGSAADILAGQQANFTNKREFDKTLLYNKRLIKPKINVIFSTDCKFTIWDDNVICPFNGENCKTKIAMRPWQDYTFDPKARDQVIQIFDERGFRFKNLKTQLAFRQALKEIKPRK